MKFYLPLAVAIALLASCNPDEKKTQFELVIPHLDEPDLSNRIDNSGIAVSGDASEVGGTTAKITAYANLPETEEDVTFGIIYTKSLPLSILTSPMPTAGEIDENNMYVITLSRLSPVTEYHYASYVRVGNKYHFGAIQSFTTTKYTIPGGAVDMGLSVKWGAANLGADAIDDYGDYFAWGELEPYYEHGAEDDLVWKSGKENGYVWDSYSLGDGATFIKYNDEDGKSVLDLEDDAANHTLGGKWRMPTREEWEELISNCSFTWETENGVNGLLAKATNGNSFFLPTTGYYKDTKCLDRGYWGDYWTSSILDYVPWYINFDSDLSISPQTYGPIHFYGLAIRPVMEY